MALYDPTNAKSILSYAKRLEGSTLSRSCGIEIEVINRQHKGRFGTLLERFYFEYEPNSSAEPDFAEAGLELKSSPLKRLKNGSLRSKERLVLNIINYEMIVHEDFISSSFYLKNNYLLLVFYLHENDVPVIDLEIKLVTDWSFPSEDLEIIRRDWLFIQKKVLEGLAHELSEGDTYYLGACTKGANARSVRNQPNSDVKASQRAYALKSGYINHILAIRTQDSSVRIGKLLNQKEDVQLAFRPSIGEAVLALFSPFNGMKAEEIEGRLKLELNKNSKSYYASLTKAIMGFEAKTEIEEFLKAGIIIRTVRLDENCNPKEYISFPTFRYKSLIETPWEESNLHEFTETKFFLVFYQVKGDETRLLKVKFWNMPFIDRMMVKEVYHRTQDIVRQGRIVNHVKNGRRKTNFPKASEGKVAHVRPHAANAADVFDLPTPDRVTGANCYTKHSFWLNGKYISNHMYPD